MKNIFHSIQEIQTLLQKKEYRLPLIFVGIGLFSLLTMSIPGIGSGNFCKAETGHCTPWRAFIHDIAWEGKQETFSKEIFEQLIKDEHRHMSNALLGNESTDAFIKDMGQDIDTAINEISKGIMEEFPIIQTYIDKGYTNPEGIHLVRTVIQKHISKQFLMAGEQLVSATIQQEEKVARQRIPEETSESLYIQFLDATARALRDKTYPFLIESVRFGQEQQETDMYDIIPLDITFTTREQALKEWLTFIQDPSSKNILATDTFRPIIRVHQMKIQYVGDTGVQQRSSSELRNVKVTATLHLFVQSVSASLVQREIAEIQELRTKVEQLQKEKTKQSLHDEQRTQVDAILNYLETYNKTYLEAFESENYRKAYSALQAMKRLYESLITIYL